jgi:hypothetical protein
MSALGDTLAALAAAFDHHRVEWYVFGAQAVAVRGAPRATQDVDVTVEVAQERLGEVLDTLAAKGLAVRYPEQFDELLAAGAVVPLIHGSGMEVDLVIAGSGLEQLALRRADRIEIDGVSVPVAHATDLVVMKVLAGRGKDLDDVRALLASGDVDVDEAEDLLRQLEEALGQSDLVQQLREAIGEVGA